MSIQQRLSIIAVIIAFVAVVAGLALTFYGLYLYERWVAYTVGGLLLSLNGFSAIRYITSQEDERLRQ